MIKPVRCFICHTKTNINTRNYRSKLNDSTIILNGAPVYYCPKCKDEIITLETLIAIKFIKSRPLKEGHNELNFEAVYKLVLSEQQSKPNTSKSL